MNINFLYEVMKNKYYYNYINNLWKTKEEILQYYINNVIEYLIYAYISILFTTINVIKYTSEYSK